MWCPYNRVSPHSVYKHLLGNTLLFILCNDWLNQCDSHILLVNKFIPYWWGVINFCGATNYKSCLCNNFSPWCDETKEIFQPYWERRNKLVDQATCVWILFEHKVVYVLSPLYPYSRSILEIHAGLLTLPPVFRRIVKYKIKNSSIVDLPLYTRKQI